MTDSEGWTVIGMHGITPYKHLVDTHIVMVAMGRGSQVTGTRWDGFGKIRPLASRLDVGSWVSGHPGALSVLDRPIGNPQNIAIFPIRQPSTASYT